MGLKENNRVRTFGIIPAYGADPIPVRLITEEAGAGMKENNRVRTFGVIPTEGADPVPVSFEAGAGMCRIKTGTYTGDGTVSQAITGVGFEPKFLWIWEHPIAEGVYAAGTKLDQSWGDYCAYFNNTAGNTQFYFFSSMINSLDADGFTVDDRGADAFANKSGQVYDYLALG